MHRDIRKAALVALVMPLIISLSVCCVGNNNGKPAETTTTTTTTTTSPEIVARVAVVPETPPPPPPPPMVTARPEVVDVRVAPTQTRIRYIDLKLVWYNNFNEENGNLAQSLVDFWPLLGINYDRQTPSGRCFMYK